MRRSLIFIAVIFIGALIAAAVAWTSMTLLVNNYQQRNAEQEREAVEIQRRFANETRQSNGMTLREWENSLALWQQILEDATAAHNAPVIEQSQQKIADAEQNIARLKGR